jgi:hypothetical protein
MIGGNEVIALDLDNHQMIPLEDTRIITAPRQEQQVEVDDAINTAYMARTLTESISKIATDIIKANSGVMDTMWQNVGTMQTQNMQQFVNILKENNTKTQEISDKNDVKLVQRLFFCALKTLDMRFNNLPICPFLYASEVRVLVLVDVLHVLMTHFFAVETEYMKTKKEIVQFFKQEFKAKCLTKKAYNQVFKNWCVFATTSSVVLSMEDYKFMVSWLKKHPIQIPETHVTNVLSNIVTQVSQNDKKMMKVLVTLRPKETKRKANKTGTKRRKITPTANNPTYLLLHETDNKMTNSIPNDIWIAFQHVFLPGTNGVKPLEGLWRYTNTGMAIFDAPLHWQDEEIAQAVNNVMQ